MLPLLHLYLLEKGPSCNLVQVLLGCTTWAPSCCGEGGNQRKYIFETGSFRTDQTCKMREVVWLSRRRSYRITNAACGVECRERFLRKLNFTPWTAIHWEWIMELYYGRNTSSSSMRQLLWTRNDNLGRREAVSKLATSKIKLQLAMQL